MTAKEYAEAYIRNNEETCRDLWHDLNEDEKAAKRARMTKRIMEAANDVTLTDIVSVDGGDGKAYFRHHYIDRHGESKQYTCSERTEEDHFRAFIGNPYPW